MLLTQLFKIQAVKKSEEIKYQKKLYASTVAFCTFTNQYKMIKSEKQIKREHFQNLVAVAFADNKLESAELKLLAQRAEEYGISKTEVDDIMKNAKNLEFLIPMNDQEKEEQLGDAVYMAMVDGFVDEREFDLCLKIAEKLDLDRNYLNEVIKLTAKLWEK